MCNQTKNTTVGDLCVSIQNILLSNPDKKLVNKLYELTLLGESNTNLNSTDKIEHINNFINMIPDKTMTFSEFEASFTENDENELDFAMQSLGKKVGGKRKSRRQNYRKNMTRRRQYGGWPPSNATKFKIFLVLAAAVICALKPEIPQTAFGLIVLYNALRLFINYQCNRRRRRQEIRDIEYEAERSFLGWLFFGRDDK